MSTLGHATDLLFERSKLYVIGTTFAHGIGYEIPEPERRRMLRDIGDAFDLMTHASRNHVRYSLGEKLASEFWIKHVEWIIEGVKDRLPKRTD